MPHGSVFSPAASLYTVSPEGKQLAEGKKKVEVIDLTLDSSSDEEEAPAKKQCPVTTAAIPSAAGPKGYADAPSANPPLRSPPESGDPQRTPVCSPCRVLSSDHQPSSVLRSPSMGAVGSDYLSSLPIPDYHPSYQVSSDMQGE